MDGVLWVVWSAVPSSGRRCFDNGVFMSDLCEILSAIFNNMMRVIVVGRWLVVVRVSCGDEVVYGPRVSSI